MIKVFESRIKQVADEEFTNLAVWMVDMARKWIWLASSISRVSSSAEPSRSFSFFIICSALRA